jgi:hypothetical protein
MSNAIEFLERMGQNASLRYAQSDELKDVLVSARIDPLVRTAIVDGKSRELETLLGAVSNVCCGMIPANEQLR